MTMAALRSSSVRRWFSRASAGALSSTHNAREGGLQPELLADAVQPRAAGRRHPTTAHDAGDRTAPLPVRGRQDLATRRSHRGELQRSLRGEGSVRAADGPAAKDWAARIRLRAGDAASPALKTIPAD